MDMENVIVAFLLIVSVLIIGIGIFAIYYFYKKANKNSILCPNCNETIYRNSIDAKQCRLCGSPLDNIEEIKK